MRRVVAEGPCANCGRTGPGLYYEDCPPLVLHLSGGGSALDDVLLGADVASPVRCDRCETRRQIARDIAEGNGHIWFGYRD